MSIVTDVSVQDSIAYLQEFVNQKPPSPSPSPHSIFKALSTEAPALRHSASAGSPIVERHSTSSVPSLRSRGGLGKGGRGEDGSVYTGACESFFRPSRLGSHRHHTTINSVDPPGHDSQPNETSIHPRATIKSTLTSSAHLSSARGAVNGKGEAAYPGISPSFLFDSTASRSTVSAPPVTRSSGSMFRYGKDRAAQPSPSSSSSHRYRYTHADGAASGQLAGSAPSLSDWRRRRASSWAPEHLSRRATAPSSFLWRNSSAPPSPAFRRGPSVSSFLWGWGDGIGDGAHSIDATASAAASTSPLGSHMRRHMHAGIGDHMRDNHVNRGSGSHTAPYAVRTPRRGVVYEEVTEECVGQSSCLPQRRPPLAPSSTGTSAAAALPSGAVGPAAPLDEPVELFQSHSADEHAVNVCRIARYLKDYYAREANEKELGVDSLGPEDVAGLAQCFYIDLYRTVRQVRRAAGMDTGAFLVEDPTEDVLVAFRPAPPPLQRELRDSEVHHLGSATSRPPDTPSLSGGPPVTRVATREGYEGVGHHGHHGTVARLPPAAAPTPPHPLPQSYPSHQLTDTGVSPGQSPGSGWEQDRKESSGPQGTQHSLMSVATDKGQTDAASKASLAFRGDDTYPVQIVRARLPPFRNDDAAAQDHRLFARGHDTLPVASLESHTGFSLTSTSLAYREAAAPGTVANPAGGGAATLPSFQGGGGSQGAFFKAQNNTQSLPQQQSRSVNDASGAVSSLPAGGSCQSMSGPQQMTPGTRQHHSCLGPKGFFATSAGSLPLPPHNHRGGSDTRKSGGLDLPGREAVLIQSLGRRRHVRGDSSSSSSSTCGEGDSDAVVRGPRQGAGRVILVPPQGRLCRIIKRPLKELMPLLRFRSTFILKYSDHRLRPHLRRFQILDCTDTYGGREVLMPHLTWATPEGVGQHEEDRIQRVRHSRHAAPLPTGLSLSQEEVSYTTALNLIYLDAVHVGLGSGILGPCMNLFRGGKDEDKRSSANENSRRSNGASAAVSGSGGSVVVDHKGRPVLPEMCAVFVFTSRPVAVSFLSEDDRQLWVGAMMGVVERNKTLRV